MEDEGKEEDEKGPSAKKPRLIIPGEKDKAAPESDEEFCIDSDSCEDSASTDDSSDFVEEDDDESEGGDVIIINTSLITMVPQDSKYCLIKGSNQKELKLVVSEDEVQEAEKFATKCFKNNLIPMFEAEEKDVAQSVTAGLAYCDCLKPVPTDYVFSGTCSDNAEDLDGTVVQDNVLCIIKLKGSDECFATNTLRM